MNLNWFYKKKSKVQLSIVWIIIVCLFSTLIYFRYFFVTTRSAILMERVDKEVTLHGVIIAEPDDFGFKKSLTVEVDKIILGGAVGVTGSEEVVNAGGKEIWIYPMEENSQLENLLNFKKYFDPKYRKNRVRVIASCDDCKFGHPIDFSGTISLPTVTEDFNSDIFLLSRGIQFEMVNAKVSKIYSLISGYKLESLLYDFKNLFVSKIKIALKDKEEAALGAGILITGKGELSKKTLEDFKRSGLVHMVVLSGFNVSIVAQVIIAVLSFLPKIITAMLGSVGIVLFCLMVGGGATVIRSLIMSLIAIYAKVFDLKFGALEAVVVAGLLMVMDNPIIIIGDPSFQLSFACTLAVILLGNASKYFFSFIPEKFGFREIVASSIAVQLFTLPLLLKFSGAVSAYGIFANIIVVPFIPFAMLSVFIMGMLCFININLSGVFIIVSHYLLAYMLSVVKYISSLDSALLEIGKTSDTFILCWYLTVVPLSVIIYRKFKDNLVNLDIQNFQKKNKKHPPTLVDET